MSCVCVCMCVCVFIFIFVCDTHSFSDVTTETKFREIGGKVKLKLYTTQKYTGTPE